MRLRPGWDDRPVGALMTTRAGGISEGAFETRTCATVFGPTPGAVAHNQALFASRHRAARAGVAEPGAWGRRSG